MNGLHVTEKIIEIRSVLLPEKVPKAFMDFNTVEKSIKCMVDYYYSTSRLDQVQSEQVDKERLINFYIQLIQLIFLVSLSEKVRNKRVMLICLREIEYCVYHIHIS